ncbi:hypothetical protein PUN28_003226 [Cardiocondyla obscurior]|uniref:Uncharacterized protein n=1 Tax=Cardiocondyla obscurior TaxID=286306 RepID=A0AAW2GL92_9HYME
MSRFSRKPSRLIVSKVYTSFPSSFSFSRRRRPTNSIRARILRVPKRGDSRPIDSTPAIYRNPLNYLYDSSLQRSATRPHCKRKYHLLRIH